MWRPYQGHGSTRRRWPRPGDVPGRRVRRGRRGRGVGRAAPTFGAVAGAMEDQERSMATGMTAGGNGAAWVAARLLAAVNGRRGVKSADDLCRACVDLIGVDAAAISFVFGGVASATLG